MFKYGQLVVAKTDTILERVSGEKVVVPAGNKVVIGFDGFAHHLRDESIQPIGDPVEGYSSTGIVEAIVTYLLRDFPLVDMLEDYDETLSNFKDTIIEALEEIGLYAEEPT